jgi:hypothetical protein
MKIPVRNRPHLRCTLNNVYYCRSLQAISGKMEGKMKRRIKGSLVFAALFVLLFGAGAKAAQTAEDLAAKAASQWLALVDDGKYAASWDQSAQLFRAAVTKEKWQESVSEVRKPLGKVISRRVKSKQYTQALPGAPDGEYVVIQYDTSYENRKSSVETVTPMLDKDGKWRVSGYYIR